ncbi:MAG: UDP-N-acetylglucosamine--N-acetylmuramyl-(pentapeptide) pyrophosphoryl-undecaprenol N-acetylglucosamine transferase, partial [Lachnospiraceae bacterium]|nr:UDP-N-acetylglucosamine--N-acetylmuramyl-(pentapeptide) pyrophosphoryl-undecaprenol N-acetylglucosamine transferase [Lachnospiraceae bacterium]
KAFCGFTDDKPVLMVTGGSLGAVAVNKALREALPLLLPKFNVCHLCGKNKKDASLEGTKGYVQFEYIKDEMKDLFAMADVIISRAGANAICEIVALKKPNILIPLPAKSSRGDQLLNAESFASQGYSKVLDQDTLTPELLTDTVCAVYEDRDSYIHAMEKSTMQNAIPVIISLIKNTIGK